MALRLYPSLESIEDGVVARLAADAVVAAYARDVRSFQGTLAQAIDERSFRDPAFLVSIVAGDIEEQGSLQWEVELELLVTVRARNLRGNEYQANPSSTTEIGTYQMVQDALRVLTGSDLDLDGLDELVPAGFELVKAPDNPDRGLSAYIVAFTTTAELRHVEPDQDLDTFGATYETPDGDGDWHDVATEQIDVSS